MSGPPREVSALVRRRTQGIPTPPSLPPAPSADTAPDDRRDEPQGGAAPAAAAPPARGSRPAAPAGSAGMNAGERTRAPARRGRPPRTGTSNGRARRAAERAEDQTRPVTVYMPAGVCDGVRDAAREARVSLGEWLLDAYDSNYERLDAVMAPAESTPRRSGLPPRRRAARRAVGHSVQIQFAVTGAELAVLDEHRERAGVDSRSEWFTVIVELGLDRRR